MNNVIELIERCTCQCDKWLRLINVVLYANYDIGPWPLRNRPKRRGSPGGSGSKEGDGFLYIFSYVGLDLADISLQ